MRWVFAILFALIGGLLGLVAGWFIGQGLDASGVMKAETFWRTDPENMWAWSAILGGAIGGSSGGLTVLLLRGKPA